MKKKIALLLAAVMTVGSLPMTAFASTTNTVSSIKTVEDGNTFKASVFLDEFKGIGSTAKLQTVKLTLTNAKFADETFTTGGGTTTDPVADAQKKYDDAVAASTEKDNILLAEQDLQDAKDTLQALEEENNLTSLKNAMDTAENTWKASETRKTELGDGTTTGLVYEAKEELAGYEASRDEIFKSGATGASDGSLAKAFNDALTAIGTAGGNVEHAYFSKGASDKTGTSLDSGELDSVTNFEAKVYGTTAETGSTDVLTEDAKASSFWYDFDSDTSLTDEGKKAEVAAIIEGLNTEYANLMKVDNLVVTAAKSYKELNDEKTNIDTTISTNKADYNKKKTEYDLASADLDGAKTAVTDAESAYLAAIGKDPAVYQAYLALQAAESGSTTTTSTTASTRAVVGTLTPGVVDGNVKYTKISDTQVMAEFYANDNCAAIELPFVAEADGSGDALVAIESVDSVVSSTSLKIANIADGATTTTISGTTSIKETATKIKSIVITETTAGSIDENATIKLKLTNGFKWMNGSDATSVVVFPSTAGISFKDFEIDSEDSSVAYIHLNGKSSGTAVTLSLQNAYVAYDEDDAEIGDECEVTVSDDGVTKESIVIGKAADYAVDFTVEDKDLPTFYAGRYDDDTESLVVTIKENIENSWLTDRKTKIVFPEGVEVMSVTEDDKDKISSWTASIDENEVTLDVNKSGKAELDLKFELSVAPDFTGDIDATLTGSGVGDDQTVTVGTAAFPVTVDADINELKIDYRNTEASDIVITEADAGVLEKGDTVYLQIDNIDFDGDPTVEVESGDMKIENVKVNKGTLSFKVKTASQKEAAVIRISDVNLYMERSLPAGEYDLKVIANGEATVKTGGDFAGESLNEQADDAIIKNYSDANDDATGTFDVDEVVVKKGYVTVVTAGRDQDDSTFTTTVSVTIGANTMTAGTKEITLDVPAYISNGYTMMPVRAVTEALSGSAIVRWDDATKTVTITFGQRVISMTVGSNVMKINGVDVAMQAQCEITDSRAFIPLRDLGYALGLNDSKIAWDDATKTATLN